MTGNGGRVGDLLRYWRAARGLSQLALGFEAEVSARHVCFVETGRSHPSRRMVERLGDALDLPEDDLNALLMAAGYAAVPGEYTAAPLDEGQPALDIVLRQQEPYPALVIDGDWNIVKRNRPLERMFGPFRELFEMEAPRAGNVLHQVCHPRGLRRFMIEWETFAEPLIQALHSEAAAGTNPAAKGLRDEVLAYPDMPKRWERACGERPSEPLQTLRLRRDGTELAFHVTLTSFALPRDATLRSHKIECLYPADAGTAREIAAAA